MPRSIKQSLLVAFILLFASLHCTSSKQSYSYYYNRCAPSTCGDSLLRFPLGLDPLCRSTNIMTSCENSTVYMTVLENTKYKLLDNLNEKVYAQKSIRLVDTSLFGCDPITQSYRQFPQIWLIVGSLTVSKDYRVGTFYNCTQVPQGDVLARLTRVPCLDCGETKNICYFYNGFMVDSIPNCRPFTSIIPNNWSSNMSGVGNLRRALQEGFRAEWDSICGEPCMDRTGGRCGFMAEDRKFGSELCFCSSGTAHKQNCSDGN